MSELRFHPEAREEAVRASVYLELARDGYGEKFEDELEQLCARIVAYPRSGTLLPGYPHRSSAFERTACGRSGTR
jgi:hypothetical protein